MPILNKWENIHKSLFPVVTTCTLVVYNQPGTLGSTIGLPKLTKFLRYSVYIPNYLLGIFVGIILGDASLTIATKNGNVSLLSNQSLTFPFYEPHFYFFHITCLLCLIETERLLKLLVRLILLLDLTHVLTLYSTFSTIYFLLMDVNVSQRNCFITCHHKP